MNIAPVDARNLQMAVEAIDQAEHIADTIGSLEDNLNPGAARRVAAYGRTFVERAYEHVTKLTFYRTGSRLDRDLRRQLATVRGRL